MKINDFRGEYAFLSNFYPCDIDGYPSVEHAFQALKATNPEVMEYIRTRPTPGEAKRAGRKIQIRAGWNDIRYSIMQVLVFKKFQNEELKQKLLATGEAELIEGNTWNDTFWGVCRGVGENNLGKILMSARDYYRREG